MTKRRSAKRIPYYQRPEVVEEYAKQVTYTGLGNDPDFHLKIYQMIITIEPRLRSIDTGYHISTIEYDSYQGQLNVYNQIHHHCWPGSPCNCYLFSEKIQEKAKDINPQVWQGLQGDFHRIFPELIPNYEFEDSDRLFSFVPRIYIHYR